MGRSHEQSQNVDNRTEINFLFPMTMMSPFTVLQINLHKCSLVIAERNHQTWELKLPLN